MEKAFISMIRDVVRCEEFQKMKEYRHHVHGSVYSHSIKVAYLCYKHHKRFGMKKTKLDEFVIGALLHDFYLYDLHAAEERGKYRFHWFRHPTHALENAKRLFPTLSATQKDMIKKHMFPLTPIPPKSLAGWLLCFYDKVAAVSDRFKKRTPPTYRFENNKRKEKIALGYYG